jgi:hypothetical protein
LEKFTKKTNGNTSNNGKLVTNSSNMFINNFKVSFFIYSRKIALLNIKEIKN